MGKVNNFPQSNVDNLESDFVSDVVGSLRELNELGKPKDDDELRERIDHYFQFCERTGTRPGIESLCLALHVTRTTLFNWNAGINCTEQCQELVCTAKSFIAAFLEQAMTRGKINPPSGIFLLKNWLGYKDTFSFENNVNPQENMLPQQSREQIAERYQAYIELPERPDLD